MSHILNDSWNSWHPPPLLLPGTGHSQTHWSSRILLIKTQDVYFSIDQLGETATVTTKASAAKSNFSPLFMTSMECITLNFFYTFIFKSFHLKCLKKCHVCRISWVISSPLRAFHTQCNPDCLSFGRVSDMSHIPLTVSNWRRLTMRNLFPGFLKGISLGRNRILTVLGFNLYCRRSSQVACDMLASQLVINFLSTSG